MTKAAYVARTFMATMKNNFPQSVNSLLLSSLDVVSATDDGSVHFRWKVDLTHVNKTGTLHGGCTAGIVDVATGISLLSTPNGKMSISTDLSISYLRPAREGELLDIYSKVIKAGSSIAFLEAEFVNSDGKIVALGKQTVTLADNPAIDQFLDYIRESYVEE